MKYDLNEQKIYQKPQQFIIFFSESNQTVSYTISNTESIQML